MKTRQHNGESEQQRATRHGVSWLCLSLCLAIPWTACNQGAKVSADPSPVGTYTLVSVDGNKVPCTVKHEGHELAVKSGAFTINADGTCKSKVTFGTPADQDATREVKATYTQQGSKLTMKWEGAATTTGRVEGDTFTMNNEGMVFAYQK